MTKCAYLRRYESLGDIFELVELKQYQNHFGHAEGFGAHTLPPVDICLYFLAAKLYENLFTQYFGSYSATAFPLHFCNVDVCQVFSCGFIDERYDE